MINIVLGIHGGIDGDVGGPFFYSRTCCCGASGTSLELPPHFDIWYPRTCNHYTMCKGGFNVTFVKACDVPWLNPEQPAWSHSPYCQNWDYVRDFTQRLGAGRRMSLTMTSLFCMPIGAGISDKTGRKPMYFFSFMLGVKSLLFNLISSTEWSIRTDPNAIILYISGFLSGMGSGAGPIGMAMMVDLIPGDMREQGFPIMSLFGVPGQIIVFAIGYMLLHKHLSHYTIFWEWSLGTDFICMLFVLFLMPETMPDSLRRPLDWWDFFPGTYYFYALRIIFNYPLLTGICPCIMLWSFSGNGMGSVAGNQLWMGPLAFRQEESLIPGLVGMICGIPANILGAIVIPRVGVWPAIFFGSFVGLALGLGSNIWPIFWMNYYHCWTGTRCGNGDWGTELFIAKWGGTMIGTVLGTFLGAISGPAGTAMISMQVKQTEQASIQAAFNLIGSLSGMYASNMPASRERSSSPMKALATAVSPVSISTSERISVHSPRSCSKCRSCSECLESNSSLLVSLAASYSARSRRNSSFEASSNPVRTWWFRISGRRSIAPATSLLVSFNSPLAKVTKARTSATIVLKAARCTGASQRCFISAAMRSL